MRNKATNSIFWEKRTNHNLSRKDKFYNPDKRPYKKVLNHVVIDVPESLDLYNPDKNQEIIDFIKRFKELAKKSHVLLDFNLTTHISAAALLLLYAKIDSMQNKNLYHKIKIKVDSLKGNVKTAIMKSGLRSLTLGKPLNPYSDNSNLPIIKGSAQGEEFEQVIDHIKYQILKDLTPDKELVLGAAVSETVGNVKLHAYPEENLSHKPWWIICSVIHDSLYLAIFDLGVGIPNTILSKKWIKNLVREVSKFSKLALSNTDADLIKLSMQAGITQTQEEKHGLGSQSINALVDDNPDGELWIFSNKGVYHKTHGNLETSNFKSSIEGTLVQWNIKIR